MYWELSINNSNTVFVSFSTAPAANQGVHLSTCPTVLYRVYYTPNYLLSTSIIVLHLISLSNSSVLNVAWNEFHFAKDIAYLCPNSTAEFHHCELACNSVGVECFSLDFKRVWSTDYLFFSFIENQLKNLCWTTCQY